MTLDLVDLDGLRERLPRDAEAYAQAHPFPHIVIDGALRPEAFAAARDAFPATDDPFWKGYLHVNETKYSNTRPDTWDRALHDVAREFCSDEFVRYLAELTGIEDLRADWAMDGGGLHQTLRGGHLNVHTDFSTHHQHPTWARRINILLYLNERWEPEWGGQLELWDTKVTAREAAVTPRGNRMLIFTTSDISFHGHPDPLTFRTGWLAVRRPLLLHRGGENGPSGHELPPPAR